MSELENSGPPTQKFIAEQIAQAALELGFARVGFAPVTRFDEAAPAHLACQRVSR